MPRALLFNIIALSTFALGVVLFFQYIQPTPSFSSPQDQLSAANLSVSSSSTLDVATSSPITTISIAPTTTIASSQPAKKATVTGTISPPSTTGDQGDEVERIENPYSTPPESWDQINAAARGALVNVLCEPDGSSSLDPISGSGVIIDPRGIILTNAHVAQYVLLSETPQIDLHCIIRTGSPAEPAWTAVVLYIPPVWVQEHADEILDLHPTGTGEHDYALLFITGSVSGSPLPAQFPYLSVDSRPAIAFPGDQILVASYPAELIGGIAAQYDLYGDTSVTTVKQLLTFGTSTPDAISLGGIIEAQSGSSGGAVVNAWGRLVGIVATTSSGTTTSDRDLRAVALSYINTDLAAQSGQDLDSFLAGNPATEVQQFDNSTAVALLKLYAAQLAPAQSVQ